jgi:hypothetical protein
MKRLAALLLGAALAASLATTPARAMQLPPGVAWRINYYSDHYMQTLIGQYQINCDWSDAGWGGISEWNTTQDGNC